MWKGETRGDGGEEDNKSFECFLKFFYRNYIFIPVFFWKSSGLSLYYSISRDRW